MSTINVCVSWRQKQQEHMTIILRKKGHNFSKKLNIMGV